MPRKFILKKRLSVVQCSRLCVTRFRFLSTLAKRWIKTRTEFVRKQDQKKQKTKQKQKLKKNNNKTKQKCFYGRRDYAGYKQYAEAIRCARIMTLTLHLIRFSQRPCSLTNESCRACLFVTVNA